MTGYCCQRPFIGYQPAFDEIATREKSRNFFARNEGRLELPSGAESKSENSRS
jgi:hypothetical protein